MERKILAEMRAWKDAPNHRALLIRGCRQTGKTHTIREFVNEVYESHIYMDLEDETDRRAIFEQGNLSANEIIDRIMFDSKLSLVPGRSAIVIDEIQACLPAYSALKALADDGRFDIIASGSLLGVMIGDLQRRSPMGYVDSIEMLPMDFEEFLWAMGLDHRSTDYLRDRIQSRLPIDDYICRRVNDLFRRYMVVGGMPAAVLAYSQSRDYSKAASKLMDILSVVRDDAERYSRGVHRMRIATCLDSVPRQLEDDDDRFHYTRIEKKKGGDRVYGTSIQWLRRTGLVIQCYNVTEPTAPLESRVREKSFKLFMSDTGMLTNMMEAGVAGNIVNRDPYSNNGAVLENAVACALKANGYPILFYKKDDSTLEVDFIANMDGEITAIEVKSGRNKRAKSLTTLFSRTRTVRRVMKIAEGNVFTDVNGVEHYPLFGPCFFKRSDNIPPDPLDDMDDLRHAFDDVLSNNGETMPSDP